MEISTRFGQYWDSQAVAQFSLLPYFRPSELTRAEWILADRLAKCAAGRVAARDHQKVERTIQSVDPGLVLRWEFDHPDGTPMFAIDRWVAELGYYMTICFWSHRLGEGGAIKAILEDGDMQRPDYMFKKKRFQEYALLSNAKKREDIALAAIDAVGLKSLEQMIAVESALATGEKIRSYGKDADMLNKMHAATRKADQLEADGVMTPLAELKYNQSGALNPQFKPGSYRRNDRSKWKDS